MEYCTYLTIYSGNKLPPFYIGSAKTLNVKNGYHGSVASKQYKKIFNSEVKNNNHLFKTKIIKRFVNRIEASRFELKLQRKAISNYCLNANKIVSLRAYHMSKFLNSLGTEEELVGKTYKQIGFDFIESERLAA